MPPAARGMSASERPRPVLRPASESPRRHWTGATNRRECFSARGHREPLPPTSPRNMPQSARASSSYSAVRPGSSVSFHAAGGLSSPRGGRSGAQQHHVPPIVRTISDQKGAQTSQAAKAAHAASANQTLLLGQPGQLSSYGVYSAESYAQLPTTQAPVSKMCMQLSLHYHERTNPMYPNHFCAAWKVEP